MNERDITILTMMAQGKRSKEIAAHFKITREYVENITYKMRQAYEVGTNTALVMIALYKGVIKLEDVMNGMAHVEGVTTKFERFKAVYDNKQYV